jgi:D-amino-acid dehydrogenase
MTHIAIVGAGITGVTAADARLDRGYRVTVFDRHLCPAMETSFAIGRHEHSCMAGSVRNIPNHRDNTIATTRMAIGAREQLFAIAEREDISFDLERRGVLLIYHDKPGCDAGLRANALLHDGGLERFPVTGIFDTAGVSRSLTAGSGMPPPNNLGAIIESRRNVRAEG